jgi:hypothetical protein
MPTNHQQISQRSRTVVQSLTPADRYRLEQAFQYETHERYRIVFIRYQSFVCLRFKEIIGIEISATSKIQTFNKCLCVVRNHCCSISNDRQTRIFGLLFSDLVAIRSLLNIRAWPMAMARERTTHSSDNRLIINVCGDRYQTFRTTLERYPMSLLGSQRRRQVYYDHEHDEYFFDRNRSCFEAILYYYQSHGRLRRPAYISLDIFLDEVTFFQLGDEALHQLRRDENIEEVEKVRLPKNRCRRYIWATMEYPHYSCLAKVVNIISLVMIFISTVSLAIESLPQNADNAESYCPQQQTNVSVNITDDGSTVNCYSYFLSPLFIIQMICVLFFTVEFLLRLLSMPSIILFIKNLMNWIDLLAIVPFYITIVIRLIGRQNEITTSTYLGIRLLRIIRCIRVLKFYRVFRNVKSLRVLITTMKQSLPDFFIMFTILTLSAFLFGSAAYFAENDTNGQAFDSIPKATYWGIMTITSVGYVAFDMMILFLFIHCSSMFSYGDIIPITIIGRIIACLCALFGAATIGMLVSVLVDRYQRVFARKLYINEEPVDLHELSDVDEQSNNDDDTTRTVADEQRLSHTSIPMIQMSHLSTIEPTCSHETSSHRIYFILGYVNDERCDIAEILFEQIQSIVERNQTSECQLRCNRVCHRQTDVSSSYNVKFELESTITDDDDDDRNSNDMDMDDSLTEINSGCRRKGNVLKTFQRHLSEGNESAYYF